MVPTARLCYESIPIDGKVLDVGCFGFNQYKFSQSLGLTKHVHFGIDYSEPFGQLPPGYTFRSVDLNVESIPFENDTFDLVVMSHVIEHLSNPINVFRECVRICKPGGLVYIVAPSERSLFMPGSPFEHDKFYSLSFYDDPTHLSRPWTPQSLYRLCIYSSCQPIRWGYNYDSFLRRLIAPYSILRALLTRNAGLLERTCWGLIGWSSYIVLKKPQNILGLPAFKYFIPDR